MAVILRIHSKTLDYDYNKKKTIYLAIQFICSNACMHSVSHIEFSDFFL